MAGSIFIYNWNTMKLMEKLSLCKVKSIKKLIECNNKDNIL